MANIAIFRINYKSDFILTLNSDAGWATPFCIKFWTGAPSQAYFVGFDGTTYTHCAPVDGEPTKLLVQFDDHHLPIGDLKFQIAYHFTVDDFPTSMEDEVINQASVIIEVDGEPAQVMLDLNGETAPEIQFSLPAYANEAQRIANEQARIAAEQQRIANEEARIAAETVRQQNEEQRIQHEEERVSDFARLKRESEAATTDANTAATLANEEAALAADKATLAQAAATLADEKAALAADKAALAQAAANLANEKAALAQQKAAYAQAQGDYANAQGDYAKEQGDYANEQGDYAKEQGTIAEEDHVRAESDHTRAEQDHATAANDHTQAASDHTRAEVDHSTASTDHTTATNDHTQAVTDHATATSDHTQAGNDHTRAESDHTRAESDHAAVEVYVDSLGAFDISAYHATGGVLAKYADLTAALGTNGANIPDTLRKGGMSVKFVQSYDNKYVQYRLMSDSFNTTEADWQGIDDKPTIGSHNFVESAGVADDLNGIKLKIGETTYCQQLQAGNTVFTLEQVSPGDIVYASIVLGNTSGGFRFIDSNGDNLTTTVNINGHTVEQNYFGYAGGTIGYEITGWFVVPEGFHHANIIWGTLTDISMYISSDLKPKKIREDVDYLMINGTTTCDYIPYGDTCIKIIAGNNGSITIPQNSFFVHGKVRDQYTGSDATLSFSSYDSDYIALIFNATNKSFSLIVSSEIGSLEKNNYIVAVINKKTGVNSLPPSVYSIANKDVNILDLANRNTGIVNCVYVEGVVKTADGIINDDTDYVSTRNFIDITRNILSLNKQAFRIAYYDAGKKFVKVDHTIIQEDINSNAYCRISFLSDGFNANDVIIKNGLFDTNLIPKNDSNPNFLVGYCLKSGDGRLNKDSEYITTKDYFSLCGDYLAITGAVPYRIAYYDAYGNFIQPISQNEGINLQRVRESDYCRISFKADNNVDFSKVRITSSGAYQKDNYLEPGGVQVNNGLYSTCASAAQIGYDKQFGLVGVASQGDWELYGEQSRLIMLDIFPISQATNVKHVIVAKAGETIAADITYQPGNEVNVISLGNKTWRCMFACYVDGVAKWFYRDYNFNTDVLSDAVEMKVEYDGLNNSLTQAVRRTICTSMGHADTTSLYTIITSSLYKDSQGRYYGCWTGYSEGTGNETSYPILFYSDDNMAKIVPFAIFPYNTNYEASICYVGSRLHLIARNGNRVAYSDNDGLTWTVNNIDSLSTNRPRIYSVNNKVLYIYGLTSDYTQIQSGLRSKVVVKYGTTFDKADILYTIENQDGVVYPSALVVNSYLYIAYSCSPACLDTDNNAQQQNRGKDIVKFTMIGKIY